MTNKNHELWADKELLGALEAYLYMLRLEQEGIDFSLDEIVQSLQKNTLKRRNEASIRYRMRNISWVLSVNGLPTLKAYSAAPQVGRKVKERLEQFLYERQDLYSKLKSSSKKTGLPAHQQALESLQDLYEALNIREDVVGIGHNQPPAELDEITINSEIQDIRQEILQLKQAIQSQNSTSAVTKGHSKLVMFGLKCKTQDLI